MIITDGQLKVTDLILILFSTMASQQEMLECFARCKQKCIHLD